MDTLKRMFVPSYRKSGKDEKKKNNLLMLKDINNIAKSDPKQALDIMEKRFPGSIWQVEKFVKDQTEKIPYFDEIAAEGQQKKKDELFYTGVSNRILSLVNDNKVQHTGTISRAHASSQAEENRMSLSRDWKKDMQLDKERRQRMTVLRNNIFSEDEDMSGGAKRAKRTSRKRSSKGRRRRTNSKAKSKKRTRSTSKGRKGRSRH